MKAAPVFFTFLLPLWLKAQLLYGPYLQSTGLHSTVLRFETSAAESGSVILEQDGNNAQLKFSFPAARLHEVTISGLSPASQYRYRILRADGSALADHPDQRILSHVPSSSGKELRYWLTGDFGKGIPSQDSVYRAFLKYNQNRKLDGWIWLGDNAYPDGTEDQYKKYVLDFYKDMMRGTVAWPCPGNHDYHSVKEEGKGPYYDLFSMPRQAECGGMASGTEGYYSFSNGPLHVVVLNSENKEWYSDTLSAMGRWLKADLEARREPWLVVCFHKPPYSKGSHDSDVMRENMKEMRALWLPVLERYGADLVFSGHSHDYERSGLLNGHYGFSDSFDPEKMRLPGSDGSLRSGRPYYKAKGLSAGTVYVVNGHCGTTLNTPGKLDHPAMIFGQNSYHGSVLMKLSQDTLKVEMIDDHGQLRDEFAIVKSLNPQAFKMNQIQLIASHNSYKLKPDPKVMKFLNKRKLLKKFGLDPEELNYGHATLDSQLTYYGVRGFELDIYADPEGTLFQRRQLNAFVPGLPVLASEPELCKPGIKLLHIKDVDYRSHVLTFRAALEQIKAWSDAHPSHYPIMINIETKQDGPGNESKAMKFFGFKPALEWDSVQTEEIDREIRAVFGEDLKGVLSPGKVSKGWDSPEAMALGGGWPLLDSARGHLVFIMEGEATRFYLRGHEKLQNRACFVYEEPGKPAAAFVIRNGPERDEKEIRKLVERGYMVRSRSDSGANEARKGDYSRFRAAMRSGAHIISTDFYRPDPGLGPFQIQLPGAKTGRSNPVNGAAWQPDEHLH
jgi:hypothetical protein